MTLFHEFVFQLGEVLLILVGLMVVFLPRSEQVRCELAETDFYLLGVSDQFSFRGFVVEDRLNAIVVWLR